MDTRVVFTKEQVTLIQQMIDQVRLMPVPASSDERDDTDLASSDVYIVKTPDDGIPKMSSAGTGTGTGAAPAEGDTLGSAECVVYRVDETGIIYETELVLNVYNLSAYAIYGNIFITVKREKFGRWLADPVPLQVARGRLTADLAPGLTGDFTVYEGDFGASVSTGDILSVRNETSCTIKSAVDVTAIRMPDNDQWQFLIYKTV